MRNRLLVVFAALMALLIMAGSANAITISGQGAGIKYSYSLPLFVTAGDSMEISGSLTNVSGDWLWVKIDVDTDIGDLDDVLYMPMWPGESLSLPSTKITVPTWIPVAIYTGEITMSDSVGTAKIPFGIGVL
jgi:hypothetical protein